MQEETANYKVPSPRGVRAEARVALFAGTFDPFTIGHKSVVDRALPLFEKLVIGVAKSEYKHCMYSLEERVEAIRQLYRDEPRVVVVGYADLTIDLAARVGARYVVKGVRSVKDFEFERNQADINRRLTGVETLLLFTEPELAAVSSSLVRELIGFGKTELAEEMVARRKPLPVPPPNGEGDLTMEKPEVSKVSLQPL